MATATRGLLLLSIAALLSPFLQAQSSKEQGAAKALAKAEGLAAKARYSAARAAYRRIVKRYAGTKAAKVAARRSKPNAYLGSAELVHNGPSENRIDVAIMGDGDTLRYQRSFDSIARVVPRLFARNRTLGEYYRYFNFRRLNVLSKETGIDGLGREADTAMGAFLKDEKLGHIDVDRGRVATFLRESPVQDGLSIVFVRAGSFGFGVDGTAVVGGRNDKQVLHEWGHAFAGLADEHADPLRPRVMQDHPPNVSFSPDPNKAPWKRWLDRGVPGIGLYQGADGRVRGAWKPSSGGCIEDNADFYCPICREALVLRIYDLVDPIDSVSPRAYESSEKQVLSGAPKKALVIRDRMEFRVATLAPKTHALEVTWWLFPKKLAPRLTEGVPNPGPRTTRGPLTKLEGRPLATDRKKGPKHRFLLDGRRLSQGHYKLICVVRDPCLIRGSKTPWVLTDKHQVLESRRAWLIEVRTEH